MSMSVTYTCDRCGHTETLQKHKAYNVGKTVRPFIAVEATHKLRTEAYDPNNNITLPHSYRSTKEIALICGHCMKELGWAAPVDLPPPTFDELLEELIENKVNEKLEP